jgi:hypothetical protein
MGLRMLDTLKLQLQNPMRKKLFGNLGSTCTLPPNALKSAQKASVQGYHFIKAGSALPSKGIKLPVGLSVQRQPRARMYITALVGLGFATSLCTKSKRSRTYDKGGKW